MLELFDTTIIDEVEDDDDVECDMNNSWFSDAIEIYGERITRWLVDRDFGLETQQAHQKQKNDALWKNFRP